MFNSVKSTLPNVLEKNLLGNIYGYPCWLHLFSLFYFKDQDLQYILHWKLNEDFTEPLRYGCYSKHFPTYPNKSDWIMPILVCKTCGISFKTCVVTSKNVAIILKQRKPQQWLVSGPREQCSEGNRHQKLLHFFQLVWLFKYLYHCVLLHLLVSTLPSKDSCFLQGDFSDIVNIHTNSSMNFKRIQVSPFYNILEWYWRLAMSNYSRLYHCIV